jgi:serine/threonine protein phosphatase 1
MKKHKKIIAISDCHGELHRLKNLFEKLSFTKNDTIIFLGDYIDRGEDSKGVIDFVLSLKDKCNLVTLKGNHEMFAIDTFEFFEGKLSKGGMFNSWMMNGGVACLSSYLRDGLYSNEPSEIVKEMFIDHGDFFNDLKLTYETENHIFVHGFLAHEQDAEDQEEWQCLWGRFPDIYPHKSGKTVVCGHSIQRNGVTNDGFRICIDTGSFLPDGYITAMVIDGAKEYFVDSR